MEIIAGSDAHIVEITGEKKDDLWKEKIEYAIKLKKPIYLILKDKYNPGPEIMDYLSSISFRKILITPNGKFTDCKNAITQDLKFYKMVESI